MFNLKRKAKVIAAYFQKPETIIREIHDSFDGATDKLLKEAKEILGVEHDLSKGERLKKIGFSMSKRVIEAREIKKKIDSSREAAELIAHYETYYPNNKFITEDLVKDICKKYGLVFGETKYFIGDVPERNLMEIEKFELRKDDMTKHECGWYKYDGNGYHRLCLNKADGCSWGYVNVNNRFQTFFHVNEPEKYKYEKPDFKICATLKEFAKNNMRVEDGYKLELPIPDPIVLQPVKGGYLIVTKWGLEAEDKDIVNEKMN